MPELGKAIAQAKSMKLGLSIHLEGFADTQCGKVLEETIKAYHEEQENKERIIYQRPQDLNYESDFLESADNLIYCESAIPLQCRFKR